MRAVKGSTRLTDAFVVDAGPFRDVGSLMCMEEEEASYVYRAFRDLNQNHWFTI